MGIKTEDFINNLPPKEITYGINWLDILESFEPKLLEDKYICECARRNPYVTCYKWEEEGLPSKPIQERLESSELFLDYTRRDLEACAARIESEGLNPANYRKARNILIKAIGEIGATEYNRREYERLGEAGRLKQNEEYQQWEKEQKRMENIEDRLFDAEFEADGYRYGGSTQVSMHEKVVRIRKGVLTSNGKPLIQRNFAKYIGYPINKYTEAENVQDDESPVEFDLLEKLVMICHANPYWLFDESCEADWAEYDPSVAVALGDSPSVFTTPDIILKWIESGKPQDTDWEDGIPEDTYT